MAIPLKMRKLIFSRDDHCWHCGATEDLVIHHRINRGMGGSKLLDTADNLMAVCGLYNFEMEASAKVGALARGWGHKLAIWEDLSSPVFDADGFAWWVLLPDGSMLRCDWKDHPF
jgi:hypothetical protein